MSCVRVVRIGTPHDLPAAFAADTAIDAREGRFVPFPIRWPPSGPFAPVGSVPRHIGPVRPAGLAPGRASQTMRPAAIAAGLIGRAASSPGRSTSRAIRPPHRIVNHLTKPREPCEHLARGCLRRNRERKKHENEQCRDSYVESCLEGAQHNPPVGVHRRLKTDDLARMLRRFGADLHSADHPAAIFSIEGVGSAGTKRRAGSRMPIGRSVKGAAKSNSQVRQWARNPPQMGCGTGDRGARRGSIGHAQPSPWHFGRTRSRSLLTCSGDLPSSHCLCCCSAA